jgi:hypothetical protein
MQMMPNTNWPHRVPSDARAALVDPATKVIKLLLRVSICCINPV